MNKQDMTEKQYEVALEAAGFNRADSKLPGHVRTTLSDGSTAHFIEVGYIGDTAEEDPSYMGTLRTLLEARAWENQRI